MTTLYIYKSVASKDIPLSLITIISSLVILSEIYAYLCHGEVKIKTAENGF